ncbi:hypothetical protein [Xenorhabdus griffiniae]|nr:hypothetical protein [Xenorhabdus griffiniae]
MNNNVIELAREIKKRSEAVLSAEKEYLSSKENESRDKFYSRIGYLDLVISPQNIIKLCEAVEKLAEYENMKPVAYQNLLTGELYSEPPKSDGTQYLALLYRHPKK